MTTFLLECFVRAALVAAATAAVLWALRIRVAAVRHAAWTAVVLTMLVLPLWQASGIKLSLPVLQPAPAAIGVAATTPGIVAADAPAWPAPDSTPSAAPVQYTSTRPVDWQRTLVGVYLLAAFVLLARLILGTVQANRLRRKASMQDGQLTSGRCVTPITVGWLKPALILPAGWQHWPPAKLAAVLTHEAEHARRHDPLVQWMALLNRAIFWFHPLSWWLERRLATLSEEACDAAVIAAGHSPEEYSGYLLDLARSMTREGRRLNVVGVAMPGSGLKERLRCMFDGVPMTPISRVRVICTVALCAISSVIFAAGTLAERRGRIYPAPTLQSSAKPKFEVASIKPCDPANGGGARGTGAGAPASPGRLQTECRTILNLIHNAYIVFADGRLHPGWDANALVTEGVPAWNKSDQFQIEAKADGPASAETMRGPMMQSLLEDRFKLRLHRETRQVPVYEMVVARNGAKVKPFNLDNGTCTTFDLSSFPQKPVVPGRPACGQKTTRVDGYVYRRDFEGISLDEFAVRSFLLDRPVINRTGIPGLVVFSVQHDMSDPTSIIPALKDQVGLELKPAVGPRDFLVIDHVELPVPDDQVGTLASVSAQASTGKAPTFDVASIRECAPNSGPAPGQRGAGVGPNSPGYLFLNCLTLLQLANMSSGHADEPANYILRNRPDAGFKPVRGGPDWAAADRFTIEARANGVTDRKVLQGPMLRALLEDRFQLKTHPATDDQPIYALKVASSGLKIKPVAPGSCYELDPSHMPAPYSLGDQQVCGMMTRKWGPFRMLGAKLGKSPLAAGSSLADVLSPIMDRAVLDQTGLDGRYDIEFSYAPDDRTPGYQAGSVPPGYEKLLEKLHKPEPGRGDGPNIFKALEQLGLNLEPTKWPVEYLIIDSAVKPKPGLAATGGSR